MPKLKILDELEDRLVMFKAKIKELEPFQFDSKSGGLDLEIYDKIQFYNSEIHYTKKKINYVKQGKSYLGRSLSTYKSGGHHKK
jgi:hypothetical protein